MDKSTIRSWKACVYIWERWAACWENGNDLFVKRSGKVGKDGVITPGPLFKFKWVAHYLSQNLKCSRSPRKNGKSRGDEDDYYRRHVVNTEDGDQPLSRKRRTRRWVFGGNDLCGRTSRSETIIDCTWTILTEFFWENTSVTVVRSWSLFHQRGPQSAILSLRLNETWR